MHHEARAAIEAQRFDRVGIWRMRLSRRTEYHHEGRAAEWNERLRVLEMTLHPDHVVGARVHPRQRQTGVRIGLKLSRRPQFDGIAIERGMARWRVRPDAKQHSEGCDVGSCGGLDFQLAGLHAPIILNP